VSEATAAKFRVLTSEEELRSADPEKVRRIGECQRCGKCCTTCTFRLARDSVASGDRDIVDDLLRWIGLREHVQTRVSENLIEIGIGIPCKFLTFDESGKATCLIYENRPLICRRFPMTPTATCKYFQFVEEIGDENG